MTEHAVVIAGGGPTGLMLAAELRSLTPVQLERTLDVGTQPVGGHSQPGAHRGPTEWTEGRDGGWVGSGRHINTP